MSTLRNKVAEGIYAQGWDVIGRGGSWAKAMAPAEKYIEAKIAKAVKAEREACAQMCEAQEDQGGEWDVQQQCANAIRARGQE